MLYVSSLTIFLSCCRALWQRPGPTRTVKGLSTCRISGLPTSTFLKERVVEAKKKLTAKKEELETNEVGLAAKAEELRRLGLRLRNSGGSSVGSMRRSHH